MSNAMSAVTSGGTLELDESTNAYLQKRIK